MIYIHNLAGLAILFYLSTARAAILEVTVGGPGTLRYTPEFVVAQPGDIVRFTFQQSNHTATQSTLQSPCVQVPNGFDTDFVPVPDSVKSGFPVAELPIPDASPIWVFCRQARHCQQGMVFAVNPGDKFAAFKAAAMGMNSTTPPLPPPSSLPPASSTSTFINSVVTVTATVTVSGQPMTTTYTTSSSSSSSSSSPTVTAVPVDHRVVVGGPGVFTFQPSNISAQIGDTVTFEFHQTNHTVTASSFDQPCRALSSSGQVGFDSGFMPVADGETNFPTFKVTVNNSSPIWAYCRQANHCGRGMVFSVNAVESGPKNFSAFQALAKQLNGTTSSDSNSNEASSSFRSAIPLTATISVLMGVLSLF